MSCITKCKFFKNKMMNQPVNPRAMGIRDFLYDCHSESFAESSIFMVFGFDERILQEIVQYS